MNCRGQQKKFQSAMRMPHWHALIRFNLVAVALLVFFVFRFFFSQYILSPFSFINLALVLPFAQTILKISFSIVRKLMGSHEIDIVDECDFCTLMKMKLSAIKKICTKIVGSGIFIYIYVFG